MPTLSIHGIQYNAVKSYQGFKSRVPMLGCECVERSEVSGVFLPSPSSPQRKEGLAQRSQVPQSLAATAVFCPVILPF